MKQYECVWCTYCVFIITIYFNTNLTTFAYQIQFKAIPEENFNSRKHTVRSVINYVKRKYIC